MPLNRWMKVGMVLVGYALALAASSVAVAVYDRSFSPADNQSMGGMIAGGEMILGSGALVLLSLVPTGLALWFVRRHRPTWSVFSSACLTFAVVGLTAAFAMMGMGGPADHAPWRMLIELLGLAQMLGSPLWIAAFLLFALLAPARDLRRRMVVAAAIEVAVGGCGLMHFLLAPRI